MDSSLCNSIINFITYLVQIKVFFCMTNMTGSKLSTFSHPGKITDYWITTRTFPYRGPYWLGANMGFDFVSGQYGFLFSRCRKYVINSLIHVHFHIGLVIIPQPILAQYEGLGMITRPIWKCPCIKLFITYFRHLEKRHPCILA